ncbi:hypothetical protein FQR65_LT00125 [Abscondita terminalis]|nr:hypothetical protein FQR65_LT00125 [Abscondita terminalis]
MTSSLLKRLRSDDVQKALDVGSVCVWPQKTKDGYAIIQYKFKSSDYWKWDIKSAIKLVFMTIEMAIFDYPARGLIILVDLENMSAGHLIRLRPQSVKLFFEYLQEALPVKLKFFHVLNSPSFLNQLISIILPLMHKEIFEKMRFHPKNIDWEDFYEQYVPKEALSKDYGGDLPCCSEIEKSTLQKLIEMEEFFDTEEDIRQFSEKTRVTTLPFINAPSSSYDTVYSLQYDGNLCKKSLILTFNHGKLYEYIRTFMRRNTFPIEVFSTLRTKDGQATPKTKFPKSITNLWLLHNSPIRAGVWSDITNKNVRFPLR